MLEDTTQPEDYLLPSTGVGIEWERILGSVFVQSENYGTRSSGFVMMTASGNGFSEEITYPERTKTLQFF